MVTPAMKLKDTCFLEEKLLDSILKSRDIANKGPSGQSYGFPSSMYGCESWTMKKAECQRIDVFELWY